MIRNVKAMGLILAVTLAIGALSASTASAFIDLLTVPKANTSLQVTGWTSELKFTGKTTELKCEHFKAVVEATQTSQTQITAKGIQYTGKKADTENSQCESSVGDITVDMNGCDYVLTGSTDGEDPKESGKLDAKVWISCPAGKEITITTPKIKTEAICTIHIPEQTATEGGVVYTNGTGANGKFDITVDSTITGITYSTTGAFCALVGLPSEGQTTDYNGTATVEAPEGIKWS